MFDDEHRAAIRQKLLDIKECGKVQTGCVLIELFTSFTSFVQRNVSTKLSTTISRIWNEG